MKHRFLSFCMGVLTIVQLYILPIWADFPDVRLHESADAGEFYLCKLVFFGESTTAHLSRRGGVLDTEEGRRQVLRDGSGTRMLDRRILRSPVKLYRADGSSANVPFEEAIAEMQPEFLVLSFGLNGIMEFSKDLDLFAERYRLLIEGVQKRSPRTKIILQSVYPVRACGGYPLEVDALNACINALNTQIEQIAAAGHGLRYADTASVLRDSGGQLKKEYDAGDGIHLKDEAYREILLYLRRHEWKETE